MPEKVLEAASLRVLMPLHRCGRANHYLIRGNSHRYTLIEQNQALPNNLLVLWLNGANLNFKTYKLFKA